MCTKKISSKTIDNLLAQFVGNNSAMNEFPNTNLFKHEKEKKGKYFDSEDLKNKLISEMFHFAFIANWTAHSLKFASYDDFNAEIFNDEIEILINENDSEISKKMWDLLEEIQTDNGNIFMPYLHLGAIIHMADFLEKGTPPPPKKPTPKPTPTPVNGKPKPKTKKEEKQTIAEMFAILSN